MNPNPNKKDFRRALMGLHPKDVEDYLLTLTRNLEIKDSTIHELERTIRFMEHERHDLIKQLNLLKLIFQSETTEEPEKKTEDQTG